MTEAASAEGQRVKDEDAAIAGADANQKPILQDTKRKISLR